MKAITFSGAAAYSLAQGAGSGALHLDNGSSGIAILSANSDGHQISAPIALDSNLIVTVAGAVNGLSLSGAIGDGGSGRSLTKAGAGTLTLGHANSYSGGSNVGAGVLRTAANIDFALGGGDLDVSAADDSTTLLDLSGSETVTKLSARSEQTIRPPRSGSPRANRSRSINRPAACTKACSICRAV